MTPEQYLEIERAAEFKSEFYAGRMYERPRSFFDHVLIAGGLASKLYQALKRSECAVITSDLRVLVSPAADSTFILTFS